jgi:hypothetical protein
LLVEARDFVQRRKIWRNFPDEDTHCIHFKSIEHKNCPLVKNKVRANTIISGYFIRTESTNPMICHLSVIAQTDVAGKIPTWIVNKISQSAPNEWIRNLHKGCEMIKQRNMKNMKK